MTDHNCPFKLAACAEMLFLDRPMAERIHRITDAGFAVEIWDWTAHDIDALAATGADFTSMTGYVTGNLTDGEEISENNTNPHVCTPLVHTDHRRESHEQYKQARRPPVKHPRSPAL